MSRTIRYSLITLFIFMFSCGSSALNKNEFSVITNSLTVKTNRLDLDTYKSILKGNVTEWSNNKKIRLVLYNFDSCQHRDFLGSINMSSTWYEWEINRKIENNNIHPIFVDSNIEMLATIERTPNSIGYIRTSVFEYFRNVYANIKVINITKYFSEFE